MIFYKPVMHLCEIIFFFLQKQNDIHLCETTLYWVQCSLVFLCIFKLHVTCRR